MNIGSNIWNTGSNFLGYFQGNDQKPVEEGISPDSANNAFDVAERFGMGNAIVEDAKGRF